MAITKKMIFSNPILWGAKRSKEQCSWSCEPWQQQQLASLFYSLQQQA